MVALEVPVGWVSVRWDGSRLERWLLLHEIQRPRGSPLAIIPVTSFPNGPAPTDGEEFAAQAKVIFDDRKASPPPGRELTRYVRCHSFALTHSGGAGVLPDTVWMPLASDPPGRPDAPQPAGNGTWNGLPSQQGQIDDGTVGIYRNGSLAGIMLEEPQGHAGTTTTLIGPTYEPPTETTPVILGNPDEEPLSVKLALSEDLGGGQRRWRLDLSSNTFYSDTFPNPG